MSVPSDTSGGCTPKPKNDRPTSARISELTLTVASMMSSDDMFGRMWRKMIRQPGHAHEAGGLHELALLERQRHPAHDARGDHPVKDREQHDEEQPRPPAERRREDRDDEERRQHQQQIDQRQQHGVEPAAEVAGERADHRRQRRRQSARPAAR